MKHFAKIQYEFLKIAADDMSGTVHQELENRLELSELPPECEDVRPTLIKQGKLKEIKSGNDVISYVRVRMKKEADKVPVYSLGVKQFPLHQEAETEISKEMFDSFYPDNVDRPQEKLRYNLQNGWDVDDVKKDGKIIAECEHSKSEDVAIPGHWKIKRIFKYASLEQDIDSMNNSTQVSVFLGGAADDNTWRQELKTAYDNLSLLDPYDNDWDPRDNIYDECAAMLKADKVIFYKGGRQSQNEKRFLKSLGRSYREFDDLDELKQYLDSLQNV